MDHLNKLRQHLPKEMRDSQLDPQIIAAILSVIAILVAYQIFTPKGQPALNPKEWQKYKLIDKIVLSPNTAIYRFAISGSKVLGLPIGQHVSVAAEIDGERVQRSYTPVSSDDDKGFFDLCIKTYPDGKISGHMATLKMGDFLEVKGPKGQMEYTPDMCKEIGMIAGGTGLTPMLQIIRAAMKNPKDSTKISFIYANVKPSDILLKKELDKLAKENPEKFKLYYVLNEPPEDWKFGKGFITKEMIEEHLPKPDKDNKILLCGPPPMVKAMKGPLAELGFDEPRTVSKKQDQVFCF